LERYFLRAGYSATADIVLQEASNVLDTNERDPLFEGDQAPVEVQVAEQEFERRAVQVGLSDGINIQITGGLQQDSVIKQL